MIYGQFSAKATAKDLTKHMSPRKPKLCMRKNGESRHESLWGLEPNRYPVFDAAHVFPIVIIATFHHRTILEHDSMCLPKY
jgi:hypothetical protein